MTELQEHFAKGSQTSAVQTGLSGGGGEGVLSTARLANCETKDADNEGHLE